MRRSPRQRVLCVLSIALAAAPFTFALIRALSSRNDLRMLWMACAAFIGASLVVVLGTASRRPRRRPAAVLALAALALLAATLLAGWTAYLLGATAGPGIWLVSFVLAFCWASSYALAALSRPSAA